MRVVVGGVSGSGKSAIGRALSVRLRIPFEDGDDLHPPANVKKMSTGVPLTDADRQPWLLAVGAWLAERQDGIIACSALRRSYRDTLRSVCDDVDILLLHGEPDLIRRRQANRGPHFMPSGLVHSQLSTLEPLAPDERGVSIDIDQDIDQIVEEYIAQRV